MTEKIKEVLKAKTYEGGMRLSLGKGNMQFFGGKTLYELKQNMSTIGQQLQKTESELSQKAIDPSASLDDIQAMQKSQEDLQARFSIIKNQHDQMEAEHKAQFSQQQVAKQQAGFEGLGQAEKMVKAKAEFFRASIENRPVNDEAKALIAIPKGDPSGGDNFLPTTMSKDIVTEPMARNKFRELAQVTNIPGLELPKLAFTLDDDDFIDDNQTAKEIKATGSTVEFGRYKFKVKVVIPDTVIYGTDTDLVAHVDRALRSGLAAKERKDALAEEPKAGLEHMSFYNGTDIKRVEGENLYEAITNSIADLHEDYRENAKIVMSFKDYKSIIKDLSNGNTNLYDAQPEKVLGKPVEFIDSAKKPIVGDYEYFQINYDGIVYDSDKDVDSGNYLFVLTAWYDQKRSLNSAFRIAEVENKETP